MEAFPFCNLELDSGFRRSDEYGKVRFWVVIPAEAGIQDHEKIGPCPDYYVLIIVNVLMKESLRGAKRRGNLIRLLPYVRNDHFYDTLLKPPTIVSGRWRFSDAVISPGMNGTTA
jgi:hypothetical protein